MPSRAILLDSNVLLLLCVGLFDKRRISTFKNTQAFTGEDFDLLVEILSGFDTMVTTPHVLTEVSNLGGQLGEPARSALFEFLREKLAVLGEHHVAATTAATNDGFVRSGLTDAAIATLTGEFRNYIVLTSDLDLYVHLVRAGVDARNFNHLRAARW